jgi:hypothetical protein
LPLPLSPPMPTKMGAREAMPTTLPPVFACCPMHVGHSSDKISS